MSENQSENQQVDAGDVESAQVDTGAQQPVEGGNQRQTEQNPPGPLEGDEQSASADDEQSGDEEGQRTDASGRVLHPWESSPKGQEQEGDESAEGDDAQN